MSGEQCAAVVGISVNQVKVYLHRARKRLRQKLEGRYRYAQD
jgi:DNA-directed RNA polymerase specialized sigma24 family protein